MPPPCMWLVGSPLVAAVGGGCPPPCLQTLLETQGVLKLGVPPASAKTLLGNHGQNKIVSGN